MIRKVGLSTIRILHKLHFLDFLLQRQKKDVNGGLDISSQLHYLSIPVHKQHSRLHRFKIQTELKTQENRIF